MVSTPSTILKLELQGSQDNAGTWNVNANQIVQSVEDAIAGFVDTATTGGATALTTTNYAANTGRKPIHRIASGQTLVSTVTITTAIPREHLVHNASAAGAFDVRFGGDASNYVTIPRGCIAKVLVRSDLTTCLAGPLIVVADGQVSASSLTALYAKFPVEVENMGIAVISSTLATPPGSPTTGDKYIVPVGGLVAWTGNDGKIAEWDGAAWAYTTPSATAGLIAWDRANHYLVGYDAGGWQKGAVTDPIPAGGVTFMLFMLAAAPTGWTKSSTWDDRALRLVSGLTGGGVGGTVNFSTLYARTATDGKVLAQTHLPNINLTADSNGAHTHTERDPTYVGTSLTFGAGGTLISQSDAAAATSSDGAHTHNVPLGGSDTAHTHDIDMRVKYADAIVCSRN